MLNFAETSYKRTPSSNRLGILLMFTGILFCGIGIFLASRYYRFTFDSRSLIGTIPLGNHTVCLILNGQKVAQGEYATTVRDEVEGKSEGAFLLSVGQQEFKALYTLRYNINILDQLHHANFTLSYNDNTVSLSANHSAPIEVTGSFDSPHRHLKHSISVSGPIWIKRSEDTLSLYNINSEFVRNLWLSPTTTLAYDMACSSLPLKPLAFESTKLYQFLNK